MDIIEKLKPFAPKVYIGFEVRDRRGKVIHKRRERGHSWVKNYYKILVAHAGFVPNNSDMDLRLRATNGNWIGTSDVWSIWNLDEDWVGGYGEAGKGIVIGTGTTPVTLDDYKLEAKISHGTGAGQMVYKEQSPHQHETTASGWRTIMERHFENQSGNSIYIGETGVQGKVGTPGTAYCCVLVCRNVHDPAVEVPDSGILTVTYTIEVTQPW